MPSTPNIVFVISDHTNADAIAPGSPCLTPNVDALAAEGTRFHHSCTPNAICSPARASLMTGLYPSTHGMWDCTHTQRPEWVDVPAARFRYFSHILAENGYRNAYFGKWHVEQSNKLEDFGWHEYSHKAGSAPRKVIPGSELYVTTNGYRDCFVAAVSTDEDTPSHPAFDMGIDFIRRHTTESPGQPFCLFVSTSEPHDTYIPPKRFFDLYNVGEIPLPESLHDDCSDKPQIVARLRSIWKDLSDDDWRKIRACYWATISFLDHEFGRLVQTLKDAGLYDDTIIVFTGDHGDMMGAHGLLTKGIGTPYEEVHNVPLVMRVPGCKPAGEDTATRCSHVDMAATLLDFCRQPPLPDAQGRSMRPVFEGKADASDWTDGYAEFYGQRFVYTQRIVWHSSWKYIFSPGGIDELYNLESDPHERKNLAGDAAHRSTVEEMCKRMWRKMRDIGDNSLLNSNYANLRVAPIGPKSIED